MTLYYEGSNGATVNLMGGGIYAQSPESLLNDSWSYSTISGVNGLGKVKRFYKDTQDMSLNVSIIADSKDEFNQMMDNMHRIFERDVRKLMPGRLWWNNFYKEVFAVESSHSDFEELFESTEKTIKFISVLPYWIQKKSFSYSSVSSVSAGSLDFGLDDVSSGFDYGAENYNAGFDYNQSEILNVIKNDCINSANFELIFYGPISSPYIIIGNHRYELYTELKAGEYAVINSLKKTIYQYTNTGDATNIFHLRNKESYIFEKIPEGNISLLQMNESAVTVNIFNERGEPEWI